MDRKAEEKYKKILCFEDLNIIFKKLEAFPVKSVSFLTEIYSFIILQKFRFSS
jgi:hypothetical protein